ncbi:glycosyltransferase family 8 protein [Enterococcus dongliensis]|uniref:glycosyltransferase family 8 protein n=1 Tax=Enterococcus dongliensis TaxID=2559925 RepID=UPI00289039A6|nr:glycosyltransferase family 8 protein [Enterococcus dongliensis]MDT2641068.1 glycosyltransferase family 8 protein [Enterococcus dongliensis]
MPIVTATDNRYAIYTEVMLRTLVENIGEETTIDFYIIDDGLTERNRERLLKVIDIRPDYLELSFINTNKNLYENCLISDHITITAYLRISVPPILREKKYHRMLYIDADTLILEDIKELYDTNLEGKTIGAVIDPGQIKALNRLGVSSTDYYFNSGIMLIDLERWQEQNITERTLDYLKKEADKILYHDQDALNAVLYEDWKGIHPKWNMQTSLVFNRFSAPTKCYESLYEEGRNNPAIIHFTGHDKPWNTLKSHPYKEQYMDKLTIVRSAEMEVK